MHIQPTTYLLTCLYLIHSLYIQYCLPLTQYNPTSFNTALLCLLLFSLVFTQNPTRMESKKLLLWAAMAALFSHNLVIPVTSEVGFDDQKNYYTPDPNARPPPTPTGCYISCII